jgi:hypothetical protein
MARCNCFASNDSGKATLHDILNFLQSRKIRVWWAVLPAIVLAAVPQLSAQAMPTATRAADIQIGIGFTGAKTGYEPQTYPGFAIYADVDPRPHWGLEAEIRQVSSGDQSRQRTLEVGGRYLRTYGALVPYAKAMYGRGSFRYPFGFTQLSYNLFAGGVGVDIKATRFIHARVEYEYQQWMSFPNGGLHPQLITFGVAYHFEGKPRFVNH